MPARSIPLWQNLDLPDFLPGSRIIFNTPTEQHAVAYEYRTDEELKDMLLEQLRKVCIA